MIPVCCYWSLKLRKPADDESLVVAGWPILAAFATGRPICMQLACWCHSVMLDVSAAANAATEWEGRSRLGSTLFNRMMVGAGRGAVMIPALSGWWGGGSSAPLTVTALLRHVKYKSVEMMRSGSHTLAHPGANFSGLKSPHGITFTSTTYGLYLGHCC